MKKKIVYLILAVLALGLFATSCAKTDLLEGTVWTCHPYADEPDHAWTLSFINRTECTIAGGGYYHGSYSGEKDKITIDWDKPDDISRLTGTIKGDEMKIRFDGDDEVYTFKKKK